MWYGRPIWCNVNVVLCHTDIEPDVTLVHAKKLFARSVTCVLLPLYDDTNNRTALVQAQLLAKCPVHFCYIGGGRPSNLSD